jgi:lysozyme
LKQAEGVERFPYKDTTGHLTIGVGHNLTARGLSNSAIDYILNEDITLAVAECETFPFWAQLSAARQAAVAELCFNLGWKKLNTFVTFLRLLADGHYLEAAVDLRQTLWATQVGKARSNRISTMIHTGSYSYTPLQDA